jgi:Polysaccharide biosynthesis C-terminal domain
MHFYQVVGKLAVILAVIYPLTLRFGLLGAAYAVACPQVLADAVGLYVVQRQTGITVRDTGAVLLAIGARTVVMIVAVLAFRFVLAPVNTFGLLALIAVGALSYGLVSVSEIRGLYRTLAKA